jgi:hypothetical protein
MFRCRDCKDTGWVCEAHPAKPYTGTRCCGCGAVEMPCPRCLAFHDRDKYPEVVVLPTLPSVEISSLQGFAERSDAVQART